MHSHHCCFLLIFIAAPAFAKNFGSINVAGKGDVYIVSNYKSDGYENVLMYPDGINGFAIRGGGHIYFSDVPSDEFYPEMYWKTPLKDHRFSYEINLDRIGCRCAATAYFVSMQQNYNPGEWGQYYCDANFVNGVWCPEYDSFEGNRYTMQTTPHTCQQDAGGYWYNCDTKGCGTNAHDIDNLMCPEDYCTIDTRKTFRVSHSQNEGYINTWFEQEGRTGNFDACNDQAYIYDMATQGPFDDGMVFTAQVHGDNLEWLDSMTGCQGECDLTKTWVTYSNFEWGPN